MKKINFTLLYEISGATATAIAAAFWTISYGFAKFSHDHANMQHLVFELLFVISSISFFWFHINYLKLAQISPNPDPNQLHYFQLCIWIIINIICSLQFDSSLLSPIYQNHILKWFQKFIKLFSNSCKDYNILIGYFGHNYYSKDVKLMRIII